MPQKSINLQIRVALLGAALLVCGSASAQELGVEFQAYPAGVILGARYTLPAFDNLLIHVVAGMNASDRKDWGEHADENGAGFGGGLAAHRYLRSDLLGPWIGVRADLWFMEIQWRDPGRKSFSNVVMFQPTARVGWTFEAIGGKLDPSISLGQEINLKTKGEAVGQGPILLAGIAFTF